MADIDAMLSSKPIIMYDCPMLFKYVGNTNSIIPLAVLHRSVQTIIRLTSELNFFNPCLNTEVIFV